MKLLLAAVALAMVASGCGPKCYRGMISVVYVDEAAAAKHKRPLTDYRVTVDAAPDALAPLPDGTFQICGLHGKRKHPDRIVVSLDGKKILSAQTFAEKGNEKDPWIIRVAGPVEGSPADFDTSWVPPKTGSGPRQK